MPNEYNRDGFAWPLNISGNYWTWGWGFNGGNCKYFNSIGNHINFNDSIPYLPIAKMLQTCNVINYYAYSDAGWNTESLCLELIPDKVIYCGKEHDVIEPRFLFSMGYSKKQKIYDLLIDIAATCQGYFYRIGKWFIRFYIPRQDETPEFYFGYHEQTFICSQTSGYYDTIYVDFSEYPENYWKGDIGTV